MGVRSNIVHFVGGYTKGICGVVVMDSNRKTRDLNKITCINCKESIIKLLKPILDSNDIQ